MEWQNFKISKLNEKGEIVLNEYTVLLTFENHDGSRSYVVFTDYTRDAAGQLELHAAIYDPLTIGDDVALFPIETDEEWEAVENAIQISIDLFKQYMSGS